MRRWLIALVLLVGAGIAWWGAGMPRPGFLEADSGAGAPRLRTATLDRGSITAVVAATGTVNPVTLVQVGSQLSGQIRELLADFNSKVTADQPIAQLDTATLEARRAAAEADVHAAAAQIAVTRAQAERAVADNAQARAQIEAVRAAFRAQGNSLSVLTDSIRKSLEARAAAASAAAESSVQQRQWLISMGGALALVLALGIAVGFVASLNRPLAVVVDVAKQLANGRDDVLSQSFAVPQQPQRCGPHEDETQLTAWAAKEQPAYSRWRWEPTGCGNIDGGMSIGWFPIQ